MYIGFKNSSFITDCCIHHSSELREKKTKLNLSNLLPLLICSTFDEDVLVDEKRIHKSCTLYEHCSSKSLKARSLLNKNVTFTTSQSMERFRMQRL